MLVHKLGAPYNPELAIGSVAVGQFFDDTSQITDEQIIAIVRQANVAPTQSV